MIPDGMTTNIGRKMGEIKIKPDGTLDFSQRKPLYVEEGEKMSGGSWDYLYSKIEEAAVRLCSKEQPSYRRSFGEHMKKISKAMHAIEWADSYDSSEEYAKKAIMEIISPRDCLNVSIAEAIKISDELIELLELCDRL